MSTTYTYEYTGSSETLDVSSTDVVEIVFNGSGGGRGQDRPDGGSGASGGLGGRIDGALDVRGIDTLEIYVPDAGKDAYNDTYDAWGYWLGGTGYGGGGGGGAGAILGGGTLLAVVDGGGGGGGGEYGDTSQGSGGGGGARGGQPGTGRNAEAGEGTGFGGDGGDGGTSSHPNGYPGEDGGAEVISEYALGSPTITTGGGNTAPGDLEVTIPTVTAPSDLAVDATREQEIDLSWTVEDASADGQRIYRATSAGVDPSSATLVADLAADTASYTDTGIDNGTDYYYLIETYAAYGDVDVTDTSNEVSGTTVLSDVTGFTLDGSVQGVLLAENFGAGLNAGQYRIRWKRSSNSSYDATNETTVAYDASPLEYTITGILDGEKYDVGIRTETPDVTGAWHTATEITALIPASGLTFTTGQKQIALDWTVESDFDGSQQIWRDRSDYDYSDPKGQLIATVGSTAATYTDSGLHPDREYTYTVRAVTQYVHADSEATTTTDSAGLAQHAAPPRGWHVEVDHSSGTTLTPQILDDAIVEPRLNEQPRVRIPVPHSETWLSEDFEGATMRVWKDGDRQPIDELEDVETEPGRSVLVGIGATQLERTVGADVNIREAHALAEELIQEETDYAANVDAPDVDELLNEFLQETATKTEFSERIRLDDRDPFYVTGDGATEQAQTLFLRDASNTDEIQTANAVGGSVSDSSFTSGVGRRFNATGENVEFKPQTLHFNITEDDVGIAIRWSGSSDPTDVRISIIDDSDDTTIGSVDVDGTDGEFSVIWDYEDTLLMDDWTGGDISAGDYRVRVEALEGSNAGGSLVDLVAFYDRRFYSDDFDNDLHESGGELDGPRLYPDGASVEFDGAETIYSIRSGIVNSVWNDTTGNQALELSNDRGRNWETAANTEAAELPFDTLGNTLRLRITVSACEPDGSQADTPRYGYAPQRLESFELRFDGDDTPLIVNQPYDEDLGDALADIADRSDSVFEARQDGDQTTIEWCQPGQRSSTPAAAVSDYTVTKRGSKTLKAVVKGGSASERETVTASAGSPFALSETDVIPGREAVRDAETGDRYRYGYDYEIDNLAGELELIGGGDIADGQSLEVEYDYKVSGEYAADEFDGDPRTVMKRTISGISTARGCQMAAKVLVDELSVPRWEADVQIPPGDLADISLVEALNLEELPGESAVIYEIDNSPEGLSLRLGSRDPVGESVQNIRDRVSAATDRV